ncbi:MAG: amino acid adenylation domain-containing protein [Enterobacteriaceae bacterium]|jgi:amino acid adenylation domain-containing protein|nr:amino acid adenylation domain-containing protein [Enterobacteriaceae bacterium]
MKILKTIPLTQYQKEVYYESQRNPESAQFTISIARILKKQVNVEQLVNSINYFLSQDVAGRLRIAEHAGAPVQQIPEAHVNQVKIIDAEGEAVAVLFKKWSEHVFNLKDNSLLDVALLRNLQHGDMAIFIRAHHIVCDGWGINQIAKKIAKCYFSGTDISRTRISSSRMTQSDQNETNPEILSQDDDKYISAIFEQETFLSQPEIEQQLTELATFTQRHDPVLFNRRKKTSLSRFLQHRYILAKDDVTKSLSQGINPYQIIISAVAILLSQIHNHSRLIIGVPLLNRRKNQLNMAGQWANTLPLPIEVKANDSLTELAGRIKTDTTKLKTFEHIPLGRLMKATRLVKSGGEAKQPFFDVTVSYIQTSFTAASRDLYNSDNIYSTATAHEDDAIAIHIHTYGDDVAVDITCAEDIFDENDPLDGFTFATLAASLARICQQLMAFPTRKFSEMNFSSPEETAQLALFEQGPHVAFSQQETLSTLFDTQVLLHGNRIAITDSALTYTQFQNRIDNRVTVLLNAGVKKGDIVAILMDRSTEMLTAIFAVLKAGAAYLPIDPNYPPERIDYMLVDSGVTVILSDGTHPALAVESYTVINGQIQPDQVTIKQQPNLSTPDSLAYMIYTSGSTGKPKGVMIDHYAAVNRIEWMQQRYPLNSTDVILQKTPISFDVSVWELFWWSISGASVHLLPPGAHKDPLEIIHAVNAHQVTTLHFVPSMLQPLLDILQAKPELVSKLASLRRVFTSGEALPAARVNQFRQVFSAFGLNAPALINLYGPTEATVDVSYFEFLPENQVPVTRIPIGFPINNISLRIMSHLGTRQPIGIAGELQIGGVGLARGYHNKPALTDEKFIRDNGQRWYRTGDLARWLSDGSIEYLGRIDNQVKIRGNRIELGEIQNTLERIPGITQAEVLPQTNSHGDTYLCAYYIVNDLVNDHVFSDDTTSNIADNPHWTAEKLREILLNSLPDFMIPQQFFRVAFIPLTPNGKADRGALKKLVNIELPTRRADAQTETECQLADIWQRVLKVDQLSVQDNFYTLGGDSILMLKVRSEAEKAGINVTLSELSQYLTVAELSRHIDIRRKTSNAITQNTMTPPPSVSTLAPFTLISEKDRAVLSHYAHSNHTYPHYADAFPATQLQLGMIYHSQQSQHSATYKDVFRYTLKGHVLTDNAWSPAIFRQSVAATIQRHPVLRSHFNLADFSVPLQIIHHHIDSDDALEISDFSTLPLVESEQLIRQYMQKSHCRDYHFDRAPLYRFHLFRTAETTDLVLSFHHAILDGGSVANLIHELFSRYLNEGHYIDIDENNDVAQNELPSPALYIQDELHALQDQEQRDFWQAMFAGLPRTQLPSYRLYENRSPEKRGFTKAATIPAEMAAKLNALVQLEHVSIKSVFFAAHCLTMTMLTGQDEIATGLVTHGRPDVLNAERALGLFLNTLPVRFSAVDKTWKTSIHAVFNAEQRHAPYRKYPLSAIQQVAGDGAKISSAFNYIHFHILAEVFSNPALSLVGFEALEETNFELLHNVMTDFVTGQYHLRCDFDGSVFSHMQAETYMDTYLSVLNSMVSQGDQPATLSQPLPERRQQGSLKDDGYMPVLTMIAKNVQTQPDAIAIRHHDLQWSYEKLWSESGKIAAALIKNNSAKNTPVAIALERSPRLIATLIGVMRAGGACLPLDLSYPSQRIAAMLEQAQPQVVIVDEQSEKWLNIATVSPLTPALKIDALLVDRLVDGFAENMPELAATGAEILPEQLAYLLFTSGSTGQPKGVAMPHRSLSNLVIWQNSTQSGKNIHSTLQYAPLSFDVSFQEIFATLAAGGELQLIAEDERRDPLQLLRLLETYQTERIYLPYVALQQLAETASALGRYPKSLKVIISSGEQLRVTDDIRLLIGQINAIPENVIPENRSGNRVILENQYGPTETHVITAFTMQGDPASFPALPPIGKSINNADVVLLNSQLREVAPGEQGEIYVRGLPVALGYYRQPALTAERFILLSNLSLNDLLINENDFLINKSNEPLYRTGDLGVRLKDGNLLCLGRKDTQVKVRGYRIELAEVELAISGTPDAGDVLKDVAVIVQQHSENDAFLVALLIGERNDALTAQVEQHLSATLPKHMIPSQIIWLETLPKTPSGKRDDAALRAIWHRNRRNTDKQNTNAHRDRENIAPQDHYEQILCELAADLLKIPHLPVHQNLFDMGGTSLTIMRMAVLVEKHFAISIPLSFFVSHPTVAQLASYIREKHPREKGGQPKFSPLVPMRTVSFATSPASPTRTSGHKRPLFFVHPMGGNVLSYLRLVKHFPADQPFYALQSHGVDAGSVPLSSVPEQAANYLDAIRQIQPHGPYSIGGWSYGGFVAFEMARQLKALGEETVDLFILDTVVVNPDGQEKTHDEALLHWFFWELLWLNQGATLPAQNVPTHMASLQERFEYITEHAIATGAIPQGSSRAVVQRLFDVYKTNWQAAADYAAHTADIDITLLHATRPLPDVLRAMHDSVKSQYRDAKNGWGDKTTGHINVIDVPGDHLEIMEEPYVAEVAKVILQEMNRSSNK